MPFPHVLRGDSLRQRLLIGSMKAQRTTNRKSPGTTQPAEPSPERAAWKVAVPPRIAQRKALSAPEEWRPGEPARRGYEKAVEDWWWL
jgi:hypothetical protein